MKTLPRCKSCKHMIANPWYTKYKSGPTKACSHEEVPGVLSGGYRDLNSDVVRTSPKWCPLRDRAKIFCVGDSVKLIKDYEKGNFIAEDIKRAKVLSKDKLYRVIKTDEGGYKTKIYLEGEKNIGFNSILFDIVED